MYLFCVSAESIAGSPLKPTHARSLVKGDACSGAVPGASPIYFSVSLSFHGKPPLAARLIIVFVIFCVPPIWNHVYSRWMWGNVAKFHLVIKLRATTLHFSDDRCA